MASRATAVQLAYEPFLIGNGAGEYEVGPIDGQPDPPFGVSDVDPFFINPWVSSVDPAAQVIRPDSAFFASPGGSVRAVGSGRAGRHLAEPWVDNTEGTFFLSFLVNFGALTNPATDTMGYRSVEFFPAGAPFGADLARMEIGYNQFSSLPIQQNPDTARLQWVLPSGERHFLSEAPFNQDGSSHGVVIKFELHSGPAADTLSVFMDPPSAIPVIGGGSGIGEPELPTAIATGMDFSLGSMSAASYFGAPSGILPAFDEIRVGTTFADVVAAPEPAGPCSDADQACYEEILSHMHLSGAEVGDADLTGDGRVTIADYRYWKDHRSDISFGASALSVASVPEPSTWLLLVLATMILGGRAGGLSRPRLFQERRFQE